MDPDYERTSFSGCGGAIDVWAPGEDTWEATPPTKRCEYYSPENFPDGCLIGRASGTSQAAAMVAGVMAHFQAWDEPKKAATIYKRLGQNMIYSEDFVKWNKNPPTPWWYLWHMCRKGGARFLNTGWMLPKTRPIDFDCPFVGCHERHWTDEEPDGSAAKLQMDDSAINNTAAPATTMVTKVISTEIVAKLDEDPPFTGIGHAPSGSLEGTITPSIEPLVTTHSEPETTDELHATSVAPLTDSMATDPFTTTDWFEMLCTKFQAPPPAPTGSSSCYCHFGVDEVFATTEANGECGAYSANPDQEMTIGPEPSTRFTDLTPTSTTTSTTTQPTPIFSSAR